MSTKALTLGNLQTVNGALTELPPPPRFANLGRTGRAFYLMAGSALVETKTLRPEDMMSFIKLCQLWDEHEEVNAEIRADEKKRKRSGYIQTFKSQASNVSALFTVREKISAEIKALSKEFLITPRSRILAKQGTVDAGQVVFDFDTLRSALGA